MTEPRLVRWVGTPSALQDPGILRGIANGTLSLPMLGAIKRYEHHLRTAVLPGERSERVLGPAQAGGFSRTYRFTGAAPFQWMDAADAERLFANRWDRWEFFDCTDAPVKDRSPMTKPQWKALLADFAMLTTGAGNPQAGDGAFGRRLAREYR